MVFGFIQSSSERWNTLLVSISVPKVLGQVEPSQAILEDRHFSVKDGSFRLGTRKVVNSDMSSRFYCFVKVPDQIYSVFYPYNSLHRNSILGNSANSSSIANSLLNSCEIRSCNGGPIYTWKEEEHSKRPWRKCFISFSFD